MIKKIIFTLSSILFSILFFYYFGAVKVLKDESNSFSKLQCVSYAPFSKDQSPFDSNFKLDEELVRKDLQLLSKYTNCIRTYSTIGLEMIPSIARENNLKMLMGAWVSADETSTRKELDTLIKLAKENKDVVKAVIVGNEVLLRRDSSAEKLYAYIKEVKSSLPDIKVTYADVWEFWLANPQIKDVTDFVTIHILPYWEDKPMNIDEAINHLVKVRVEVEEILGNKSILIGETGWPSEGRMREDVLPSKINQALYVREFVKVAQKHNWDYNIIEAFDQPWKRLKEGAVGGYWGLFDKDRGDKNVFKGEVSDFPNYKYLAFAAGVLIFVFSFLLRKEKLSSKKLFVFSVVNILFSILYVLQVEQYFITVRTNIESVWAFFVLLVHLFIYYFMLENLLNKKKAIPISLFYFSSLFVVVISLMLAIDGRYQNFEIYAFIISAISFLWLLKDRYDELNFNGFEKLLSFILFLSSILILKNETISNSFSNIWILISLAFIFILYKASKKVSFLSIKNIIIYIASFIVIAITIKYAVLMNHSLPSQLESLQSMIGVAIHYKVFGLIALFSLFVAFFIKKRVFSLLTLFFSILAIFLYNIFIGSIVFYITLYLLQKREV